MSVSKLANISNKEYRHNKKDYLKSLKEAQNEAKLEEFKSLSKDEKKYTANLWARTNFETKEDFFSEYGLNYYESNSINDIKTSMSLLKELEGNTIKIEGQEYKVGLTQGSEVNDYSSSDNPMILMGFGHRTQQGSIEGTKYDDIIVTNGIGFVSGNDGNDIINTANSYTINAGLGDDRIIAQGVRTVNGDDENSPDEGGNDKIFADKACIINAGAGYDSVSGKTNFHIKNTEVEVK